MSRAQFRDVFFHADGVEVGGLVLNPSVTQNVLLTMIDVLIRSESSYKVVHRDTNVSLIQCASAVPLGIYDIQSEGKIRVTDERPIFRALSRASTPLTDKFREQVRERDGMCVITKVKKSPRSLSWATFHAAHISPVAHENLLSEDDALRNSITVKNSPRESGIHSVQNGILLAGHVHSLFDLFQISVNPDDDYKVVCFDDDIWGLDGKQLDLCCRDPRNEFSVPDDLLRWHFRQAIIINMKGQGGPVPELDFPEGSDMMSDLRSDPDGGCRMEFELFTRLSGHEEASSEGLERTSSQAFETTHSDTISSRSSLGSNPVNKK